MAEQTTTVLADRCVTVTDPRPVLADVAGLSARQQTGQDCVCCGIVLGPDTAVSLGTQTRRLACGTELSWWPRACKRCRKGSR